MKVSAKLLFAFILLSFGISNATEYTCEKTVEAGRVESTKVVTYPAVLVSRSFQDCNTPGCAPTPLEQIVTPYRVCDYSTDVNLECKMTETILFSGNYKLVLECVFGQRMVFTIDPKLKGKIECYNGKKLEKSWAVGTCNF